MSNLSFIVPVENKDSFELKNLISFAEELKLEAKLYEQLEELHIFKKEVLVTKIFKVPFCYLLNSFGQDDNSKKLQEANLQGTCFIFTYELSFDKKKLRTKLLTKTVKKFKGYWLDEGIHPEFIRWDEEFLNNYI